MWVEEARAERTEGMARGVLRAALVLSAVAGVVGHGILTTPQPRAGTNVAGGNKGNVGPCGTNTNTPGTQTATLTAGEQTAVRYNLVAAHNGPCEVRIAATQDALANTAPLARNAACNSRDDLTVTVPANLAGTAVLQWYWDGDAPYYDCADITVSRAAGGANSATRDGATSSDADCEGESCGGSGTKIFGAVLLILGILGGIHYCRSTGGTKGTEPPPLPPPIPQRPGPALPPRTVPAQPRRP